jgi:putative hydrolase of the HAD superfamily
MPAMGPAKQRIGHTRAVLLDALGTLVTFEAPWTHLARALGVPAGDRVERAMRTEMAYYREHSHEGRDAATLADLRRRCAEVLSSELGRPVGVDTMMASIRFHSFPDAAPALRTLRDRGLKLVCVSNWDCSLPDVLAACGLGSALDGVVTSAAAGASKPDPAIFVKALRLVGCEPAEALHVGDTPAEDIDGAHAAGIPVLLIDRSGGGDITSLSELEDLVGR